MMKKTILLCIVTAMIIGSCAREKYSPLEGIWKLTYGNWYNWRQGDTLNYQFPGNMDIYHIKIFSNENITYVGHYSLDGITYDNFGGGKFSINGEKYEENLLFAGKAIFSRNTRMLMEIDNDTLIQKWPVDENWHPADKYNIEKYIRLK